MATNNSPLKQYPVITPKDSLAIKHSLKANELLDADELKKGKANPNKMSYHTNLFVYSDAPRNSAGIGTPYPGHVKGGDAAISSYERYRTNKKLDRKKLEDFKVTYGENAVEGIAELHKPKAAGPKPERRTFPGPPPPLFDESGVSSHPRVLSNDWSPPIPPWLQKPKKGKDQLLSESVALPQNDLTKEQIDKMTQEEWDDLPIVTGTKEVPEEAKGKKWMPIPGNTYPAKETVKSDNKAIKLTKGIFKLLSAGMSHLPTPGSLVVKNIMNK